MEINYSKTTFTHIHSSGRELSFMYHIGNHPLHNAACFKYLGVSIMHTLKWHAHIDNICSKANKKLYFLKKKLEHATPDVKLTAYKTFIRPVLEYASIVWSPHQKVSSTKIERIQKLAVRFICGKYRRTHSVTALLKSCELESLEHRRRKHRLKFLFKIISGQTNLNKDLYLPPPGRRCDRLNNSRAIQPYSTRTNAFCYSFFPDTIEMRNSLPNAVVQQTTSVNFENALDSFLCSDAR